MGTGRPRPAGAQIQISAPGLARQRPANCELPPLAAARDQPVRPCLDLGLALAAWLVAAAGQGDTGS